MYLTKTPYSFFFNWIFFFFSIYFFVGIFIFKDYGVSVDEEFHRQVGFFWLNYIFNLIPDSHLKSFLLERVSRGFFSDFTLPDVEQHQFYHIFFDILAGFFEIFLNFEDSRDIFLFRHFLNFTIFFISSIFFYNLIKSRFKDKYIPLIVTAIYIFTPRIFGESFYNPKDIIFLSVITIVFYFFFIFFKKINYKNCIILSLFLSIAIISRVAAFIVLVNFFIILLLENISSLKNFPSFFKYKIFVFFLTIIFTFFLWPYLWSNPFGNFILAIKTFSKFNLDFYNLYLGDYIKTTNIPWHYIFVWFFISNPIFYSILSLLGFFFIFIRIFKRFLKITSQKKKYHDLWRGLNEKFDLFIFLNITSYIFLILKLNASLYDSARQVYFFHFFLVYFTAYFLNIIIKIVPKKILYIFSFSYVFFLISTNIYLHPYQNVYFNFIVQKPEKYFPIDYWGVSNMDALNFIIKNENKEKIFIANSSFNPLHRTLRIIKKENIKKIVFVGQEYNRADYILDNFYSEVNKKFNKKYEIPSNFELYYQLTKSNITVYRIYKRKINI